MDKQFKVWAWNVKGLESNVKRPKIKNVLHKRKTDIVFIYETHQKEVVNELKCIVIG